MSAVTTSLSEDGKTILIDSTYMDRELCKQIPGAKWDGDLKKWVSPISWATCNSLRTIFGERLEMDDRIMDWAWGFRQGVYDQAMQLAYEITGQTDNPLVAQALSYTASNGYVLKPYQAIGAAMIAGLVASDQITGGIEGDPMGLGKTAQAIVALRILYDNDTVSLGENRQILIVCPNSVKRTWVKELQIWWPEATVRLFEGSAVERSKIINAPYDLLVCNWEQLRLNSKLAPYGSYKSSPGERASGPLNRPWFATVFDEAHKCKNPAAKQTRAAWAIADGTRGRVIAMSGTPIAQNIGDFWAILRLTNYREFPAKSRYIDRYCLASSGAYGGLEVSGLNPDREEEFHKVTDYLMRRVPKSLVLSDLPPKVYETRYLPMSKKQKDAYKKMADEMLIEIGDEEHAATNTITKFTRMLQFSSATPDTVTVDDNGATRVTLTAPSNKLDEIMAILEDELEPHEGLVVFTMHKQVLDVIHDALAKAGVRCSTVIGGQSLDDRERSIEAFQSGQTRVILCTVSAGGVGITLTRARVLVYAQLSFSLVDMQQSEDRVHRIGSEIHDQVKIIFLVSEDTVDQVALDVREGKIQNLQEIVRDDFRKALHGG